MEPRRVPPGWSSHQRPGSIELPPAPTLIVEGVGAGRATQAREAQATIWVQSDRDAARRHGLERDIELGRTPAEARDVWHEWMAVEDPFQDTSAPWSRADLIPRGTTNEPVAPGWGHVSPGPLSARDDAGQSRR